MAVTYADRPWLAQYPDGVPASLNYPDQPLVQLMVDAAAKYPDNVATIFFGAKITYRELHRQVQQLAGGLRAMGVQKGDRVAIMLPNCPQTVIAYFAVLWLGATVAPVNPLYTPRELRHQLKDAGVRVLIALDLLYPRITQVRGETDVSQVVYTSIKDYLPFPLNWLYPIKAKKQGQWVKVLHDSRNLRFLDVLKSAAPVAEPVAVDPSEDLATLLYTGGTTGTSKGVMLTHRNMMANVTQCDTWVNRDIGAISILAALPFFHSYGLTTIQNYAVLKGGTMVLVPRFEVADILKVIQKHKPNVFPGAPTMYVAINNHPDVGKYDLSSIEACISGAAALPVEVQETFERLTGSRLVEGYGLTEASPVTHGNPIWDKRKNGSIGLPWPDTDCKIVDLETAEEVPVGEVGELCIRGPQIMRGYWNRPDETAATLRDGWLFTGDMARMDEEGFFYIVDRKKDMIVASGFNVYPREVEDVLYEHPAIKEAAVVGVADPYRGETVKAFVVLKDGATASAEEIVAFCRENLAAYKVPKLVEFRDDLPKSLIGKVLRRVLQEEETAKGQAAAAQQGN